VREEIQTSYSERCRLPTAPDHDHTKPPPPSRGAWLLHQPLLCNRLIVQSDCMEVVEIMNDGGFTANSAAAIYDECTTI
jgi:hypothetical protein